MKKKVHPQYFNDAKIICSCGAVLHTGATQKELHVEICSACHPFYTGKKKMMDTTGRVDRFKKLSEKAAEKKKSDAQAKKSQAVEKKAVKAQPAKTAKAKKAAPAKKTTKKK